jgi:spore germination protein GerM
MSPDSSKQSVVSRLSKGLPFLAILLVCAVVFIMAGCNPKSGGNSLYGNNNLPRDVVAIFFSKYQGNQSIVDNVIRKLPPDARHEPLQFALTELLKGPNPEEKSQGFYSEIPKGTRLLSLKQDKESVTINLSRQFETGGGSNSMTQRFEELKQTVFSVDSTHKINLTVEGKPLDILGGEGLEVQDSLTRQPQ